MDEQEKLLQSIGNIFDQKFDERFTPLENKVEKYHKIFEIFLIEICKDFFYSLYNSFTKKYNLEDSVEDFLVRKQHKRDFLFLLRNRPW